MIPFRVTERKVDPSPLIHLRNFHTLQSALYRGDLDVTLENTKFVETRFLRDFRTNFENNQDPEGRYLWGFPDWATEKDTRRVTEEGVRKRLNSAAWEGFELNLVKILACGGFGAATLWDVKFEDGSVKRVVIKLGLKGNYDGAGELSWHRRYWGNSHIVQAIDLHQEGQNRRTLAWERSMTGFVAPVYSGEEFDMAALNVVVLEYVECGDLFELLANASKRNITFSTKVLWEFFECFVFGLLSIAYQPTCTARNPDFCFEDAVDTARREKQWSLLTDHMEKLGPTHDVHFDIEEQNILVGLDEQHHYRPVFKLHDFGSNYSLDMDKNWNEWRETDYWVARQAPKPSRLTPEQAHKRWEELDTNLAHEGRRFRGPNLEEGEEIAGRYGMWTNVFRIGAIMESIMTGAWKYHPFDAAEYTALDGSQAKTYGYRLDAPQYSHLDWELKDIVCQCMSERPADRPTLPSLVKVLVSRFSEGFVEETDTETYKFWNNIFHPAPEVPLATLPATVYEGGVREPTEPTNPNTPERVEAQVERDNANVTKGKGKQRAVSSRAPGKSQSSPGGVRLPTGSEKGKGVDRGVEAPAGSGKGKGVDRGDIAPQQIPLPSSKQGSSVDVQMADSSILEKGGPIVKSSDQRMPHTSSLDPDSPHKVPANTARPRSILKQKPDNATPEYPVEISNDEEVEEEEEAEEEEEEYGIGTITKGSTQPTRLGAIGLTQFKVNKPLKPRGQLSRENQPFPLFAPPLLGRRFALPADIPPINFWPTRPVPARDPYSDGIDVDEEDDVAFARITIAVPDRSEKGSSVERDEEEEELSDHAPAGSGSAWSTQNVSTNATSLAEEAVPDVKRERENENGDGQDPHYTEQPAKKQRRQEPEFYQPTKLMSPTIRTSSLKPQQRASLQPTTSFSSPRQSVLSESRPEARPLFQNLPKPTAPEPAPKKTAPTKKPRLLEIGRDLIPIKNKSRVNKNTPQKPPRRLVPAERVDQYIDRNLHDMPVAIQNLVARSNALEAGLAQRAAVQEAERQIRMRDAWVRQQQLKKEEEGEGAGTGMGMRNQRAKSESESD